jgi:multidrug transporter EmrE-like cation transporter
MYGIGNVLLKLGNMDIGSKFERFPQGEFWFALVSSVPIIATFEVSFLTKWIMGIVLSKNPLGISEGLLLAFSALTVFILGISFFGETVNFLNVIGLILIVIGLLFVYSPETEEKEEINSGAELR